MKGLAPVLVVGPGAVGGVLAARWAALRPVLIWGRDAASEDRLVRGGIEFSAGARRPRRLRLASARRSPQLKSCAAAFLCVKSSDVPAALKALRRRLPSAAPVVGLQNGLGHEALLRRAFGRRAVLGSCYFAADRPAPGRFIHRGGDELWLARRKDNAPAVERARRLLAEAGWTVRIQGSEPRLLWTKLIGNAAINPLGAACAATNGQLADEAPLKAVLLALVSEILRVSSSRGISPYFKDPARTLLAGCRAAPLQRNSMLQDLAAGRPTERRAILGPILAAARRARAPVPILAGLDRVLARLEARARRNARP